MTPRERIHRLCRGNEVDHLSAQPMVMMMAARHFGISFIDYTRDGLVMADAQLKFAEDFGVDVLLTCSDPAREVVDIAGEGSVVWLEDQGPVIDEEHAALANPEDLIGFRVPGVEPGGRMHDRVRAIERMRLTAGNHLSIVGWVEGPLALAQELRGLNRIMTDFFDDPKFVEDLLDFTSEVAIAYAPAQVEAGADTIGMSDAAASLIGPALYERFVLPRQIRVLRSIKSRFPEVLTRVHMCGDTNPLLHLMAQLPTDIVELDFPVDLTDARRKLSPQQVISGNVSTVTELIHGTPDSVSQAVAKCHAKVGPKFIVGSGCEVSPFTPPENIRAMASYAQEHQP
ncbi:MAG: uroporphyrinogen decarboxylase family protein [Fimbriimonas sp.]|nr:uroporphyrinogen decarboxylase family protein [Fimbriimonas sp.]